MTFPDLVPDLRARMPGLRGRLSPISRWRS